MLQNSTGKAGKMLQVSWEAAAIIGIASFVNMVILAYLIRSKITKVYSDVETKITKAFTSGLGDVLADVGHNVVNSGVSKFQSMYPQVKEDMLSELGVLTGEAINTMFMKMKMSAMGALGGATMHDKKLVNELGSILKEEILPAVGNLSGNPLVKFVMGNERIQCFIENNPEALPLIQQHLMPFISKFMSGNSPPQPGVSPGQSSFGRPI
jgi:hypothetical protein